jgi:hypothetical protein
MKFIDIAFGTTVVAFGLGALAGGFVTAFSLTFRDFMLLLINLRIVTPVRAATVFGRVALMLLIFLNNCIPVTLSFAYPLIIGKVRWTPPLRATLRNRLLTAFSILTGGLLGFFNLGATLMLVEEMRGPTLLNALLRTSWVHAPLEFLLVLACVAEPLRLTLRPTNGDEIVSLLRADVKLLFICLVGLIASAAIEVFAAA